MTSSWAADAAATNTSAAAAAKKISFAFTVNLRVEDD
jgi:hypothetical protein